jgi:hypothetical protein
MCIETIVNKLSNMATTKGNSAHERMTKIYCNINCYKIFHSSETEPAGLNWRWFNPVLTMKMFRFTRIFMVKPAAG